MYKLTAGLITILLIGAGCATQAPDYSLNGPYNNPGSYNYYDNDYDYGYGWAEDEDIDNFDDCQDEFGAGDAEDGCNDYVRENYTGYRSFGSYDCTEDCGGHEAGYAWAERNDIYHEDDCGGNSNSFIEGCLQYVEDYY